MKKLIDTERWRKTYDEVTSSLKIYDTYDSGFDDALDFVDGWIDSQPCASEWISVKERLPEVEADILAYIGEGSFVVCWMTHDGYWQCPAYLMDKDDVTHWMTLPRPPKEKGENA